MGNTPDSVIRIFACTRQAPGAAYQSDRLLAYLTQPPAATGRRDTFAGRRRFVRFMEALQLEFGVCFTNDEWERGLGLSELTGLIEAKQGNAKAQARLASKRVQETRRALVDEPTKIGLVSAAILGALAVATKSVVGYAFLGSLWICLIVTVVVVSLRGYGYAKRLAGRMGGAVEQADAADEAQGGTRTAS